MKTKVLFIVLSFILVGLTLNIASSNGNIGIVADISSCGVISTDAELTTDLLVNGTCLNVTASHITIDGKGFSITGNETMYGINITAGLTNVTIKNFLGINNFTEGIHIEETSTRETNHTIFNNTISSADQDNGYGMYLTNAGNNNISDNNITTIGNTAEGIYLDRADGNLIFNNLILTTGSGRGIRSRSSVGNTISYNNVTTTGSSGRGLLTASSSSEIIAHNRIITSNSNAHGISLSPCTDCNLTSNFINTSGSGAKGIYIHSPTNNRRLILLNNTVYSASDLDIQDDTDDTWPNRIIYNNTFGNIEWLDNGTNGFVRNSSIDTSNDQGIGFGRNLFIGNNSVALNSSGISYGLINSSANITFYNYSLEVLANIMRVENYTTDSDVIITAGTGCNGTSCLILSNVGSTIIFNTSHFSSFASNGTNITSTPTVTIHSPIDNFNYTTEVQLFNATVDDEVFGIQDVYFYFTNTTPFNRTASNTSGYWNISLDMSTLDEGIFDAVVFSNNTKGTTNNTQNVSITIDRTAPTINLELENETNFSFATPNVSFNFTDNIFPTASCEIYVDGVLDITNSSVNNATSTNFSVTSLSEGFHFYSINCTDGSNNTGESLNYTLNVDLTSPLVTPTGPTNGSNFTTGSHLFNATITDNLLGISGVLFSFANGSNPFNLTASNTSGGWNVSLNTSLIAEGIQDVTIIANDTAGNVNDTENITVTFDRSAPAVTLVSPTNGTNLSYEIQVFNATVLDNLMEIDTVYFRFSNGSSPFNRTASNGSGDWNITFNVTILAEGAHTVSIYANDSVNNLNHTENITLIVDRTAPAVNLETINSTNTTDTTPTINFNFTDSLSATANCSVYVDDVMDISNVTTLNGTSSHLDIGALGDGVHRYSVNCTDASGNVGVSTEHIITIDSVTPNIFINTPDNGSNLSTGTQLFNVTLNDTTLTIFTVQNVIFQFTNGSFPFNVTPIQADDYWTSLLDLNRLVEDNHTLTIVVNDTAGNTNDSGLLYFTVDQTAPVVNLETINDTNISITSQNISFNFTDNIFATASCTVYVDNVASGSNTSVNNLTSSNITLTSLSAGRHEYYVNCTDSSGNNGTSDVFALTVDTTPPNYTFITPTTDQNFSSGLQAFNVTVVDDFSNISSVQFQFANVSHPFNTSPQNGSGHWNTTFDLAVLGEGRHSLVVVANDTFGNENATGNITFTVDRTNPIVNLETGNQTFTIADPVLSFNFTDDQSTFASCTLTIGGVVSGSDGSVANGTSTSITSTQTLADGTYNWNVTCTDAAGNNGTSTLNELTISLPAADAPAAGGGGGGGGHSVCQRGEKRVDGECVVEEEPVECESNDQCPQDEYCVENECVQIFDLKTVDITSPVDSGTVFNFSYFVKGMADISGDVTIEFWIENDTSRVTEGSDVIFIGSFEEKTEESSLRIPSTTVSGVYTFFVTLTYEEYHIESFRTVEILNEEIVEEEVVVEGEEEGEQGQGNFAGQAVSFEGGSGSSATFFVILALVGGLMVSFVVVKRRRRKDLTPLENWAIHLLEQDASQEDMYASLLMQHYWKKRDLKKVFERIAATNNVRDRHTLIDENVLKLKRFVVESAKNRRSKKEVINILQLHGLDTDVVEKLVKVHY
jgi:parallel beta-helix repeat protein